MAPRCSRSSKRPRSSRFRRPSLPHDERETRQLGVVTADGRAASFTGSECNDWAGHETGDGFAVQGNILGRRRGRGRDGPRLP